MDPDDVMKMFIASLPREFFIAASAQAQAPQNNNSTTLFGNPPSTTSATISNVGSSLQASFPFMKLPPEIRLIVYEFAISDHLVDIECTRYLQTPRPQGTSREAWLEARMNETARLSWKYTQKPAPYMGVLALLHTSKRVHWESYHAMNDFVRSYIRVRRLACERAAKRIAETEQPVLEEWQHLEMYSLGNMRTCLTFMQMVETSLSNTSQRYSKNLTAMILQDHSEREKETPAADAGLHVRPAAFEVGVDREAGLLADIENKFVGIYAGVQSRLESGAGVRTAFKAEVALHIGVELSDDGVKAMIRGIVQIGASLKSVRGSKHGRQLRSSREVRMRKL